MCEEYLKGEDVLRCLEKCVNPKLFLLVLDNFDSIALDCGEKVAMKAISQLTLNLKEFALENGLCFFSLDEARFALVSRRNFDLSFLDDEIEKIKQLMINNRCYQIGSQNVNLRFKMGISLEKDEPLRCAKRAVELARLKNRSFVTYCEFVDSEIDDTKLFMAGLIENSIRNNKLIPFFQAVVDGNGEVEYFDELARIIATTGMKEAKEFIDVVSKYELDAILTRFIINNVSKYSDKIAIDIRELSQCCKEVVDRTNIKFKINVKNLTKNDLKTLMSLPRDRIILVGCDSRVDLEFAKYAGYVRFTPDWIRVHKFDELYLKALKELSCLAKDSGAKTVAHKISSHDSYKFYKELEFDLYSGFLIQIPQKSPNYKIDKEYINA